MPEINDTNGYDDARKRGGGGVGVITIVSSEVPFLPAQPSPLRWIRSITESSSMIGMTHVNCKHRLIGP